MVSAPQRSSSPARSWVDLPPLPSATSDFSESLTDRLTGGSSVGETVAGNRRAFWPGQLGRRIASRTGRAGLPMATGDAQQASETGASLSLVHTGGSNTARTEPGSTLQRYAAFPEKRSRVENAGPQSSRRDVVERRSGRASQGKEPTTGEPAETGSNISRIDRQTSAKTSTTVSDQSNIARVFEDREAASESGRTQRNSEAASTRTQLVSRQTGASPTGSPEAAHRTDTPAKGSARGSLPREAQEAPQMPVESSSPTRRSRERAQLQSAANGPIDGDGSTRPRPARRMASSDATQPNISNISRQSSSRTVQRMAAPGATLPARTMSQNSENTPGRPHRFGIPGDLGLDLRDSVSKTPLPQRDTTPGQLPVVPPTPGARQAATEAAQSGRPVRSSARQPGLTTPASRTASEVSPEITGPGTSRSRRTAAQAEPSHSNQPDQSGGITRRATGNPNNPSDAERAIGRRGQLSEEAASTEPGVQRTRPPARQSGSIGLTGSPMSHLTHPGTANASAFLPLQRAAQLPSSGDSGTVPVSDVSGGVARSLPIRPISSSTGPASQPTGSSSSRNSGDSPTGGSKPGEAAVSNPVTAQRAHADEGRSDRLLRSSPSAVGQRTRPNSTGPQIATSSTGNHPRLGIRATREFAAQLTARSTRPLGANPQPVSAVSFDRQPEQADLIRTADPIQTVQSIPQLRTPRSAAASETPPDASASTLRRSAVLRYSEPAATPASRISGRELVRASRDISPVMAVGVTPPAQSIFRDSPERQTPTQPSAISASSATASSGTSPNQLAARAPTPSIQRSPSRHPPQSQPGSESAEFPNSPAQASGLDTASLPVGGLAGTVHVARQQASDVVRRALGELHITGSDRQRMSSSRSRSQPQPRPAIHGGLANGHTAIGSAIQLSTSQSGSNGTNEVMQLNGHTPVQRASLEDFQDELDNQEGSGELSEEQLYQLVEALEQRVLTEIERRGGRRGGIF